MAATLSKQEALKRASQVCGVKPEEVKQVAEVMMMLDCAIAHIHRTSKIRITSFDISEILFRIKEDPLCSAPPLIREIVKTWDQDRITHVVASILGKKSQPSAFCEFLKGFIG